VSETEGVSRQGRQRPSDPSATKPMDEAAAPGGIGPGDRVGRYQIRNLLGAGGMGVVFTAFDPELERTVALKLIRFEGRSPSSRARTRLLREAQALAKLQHPNVVTIYDVGTDGDQVFIAMELISGQTLGGWLDAAPRSWRAIRDIFLDAGRGLAAAHAVGIVHRDFKPSNVIVGADRVVVVDFGLALARGQDVSTEEESYRSGPSLLELHLTLTGERVGTPRYMAPEQHLGTAVTPLADQFAFANALWSALYGSPPFAGETREDREKEIAQGPATPPPESKVPDRVRDALRRALALEPSKRWPTLPELLAELTHDPEAARRRFLVRAATLAAVLGVSAAAFSLGRTAAAPQPCTGAESLVAPLWDDAARAKTHAAFRATGRPYADQTFARVDASLNRRLADWTRAHRDACEATEVRHEQSPELLDARMACLGRARGEIAALVPLLSEADADMLDRAAAAAGTVGDVGACAELVTLREIAPPPREPAAARAVEEVRAEVARLRALKLLGKVKEGRDAGHLAVAHARATGYAPVIAAALDSLQWFEVTLGNDDAALEVAYQTARVAAEARDDATIASALTAVAFVLGYEKQHFEAADVAYQSALTAAARAANPGPLLEHLYGDRESVLYQRGDYPTTLALSQVVYALSVRLHGADSYQAAISLSELADATRQVGDPTAADRMFRRALAVAELALAPEHPVVLSILNNAGRNRLEVGDVDGAAPFFQRAFAAKEKLYGPDDASIAITAHNLGIVRCEQRRLPEARALFERAIRIRLAKLGPDHPLLATSYVELARVDGLEGRVEAALANIDRAIAIQKRAYGAAHPSLVESIHNKAGVLLRAGRLPEAKAALADARELEAKAGVDPSKHAEGLELDADLLVASKKAGEAIPLYRQALALLEAQYGKNALNVVEALLGLGAAQLDVGDVAGAVATAERAVTIETYGSAPIDVQGAAQFLLARARWAQGDEIGRASCRERV